MKKYEAVCVLFDTLKGDDLDSACVAVSEEITRLGGTVSDEKRLGVRNLARPTSKAKAGNWVELAFELAPDQVVALRERFKLNEFVVRVMIVRAYEGTAKTEKEPEPASETT